MWSIDLNMASSGEEPVQSRWPTDKDIVDVNLLISSIEERPLLRNKTLDSFYDRNEKSWGEEEVSCLMKPE